MKGKNFNVRYVHVPEFYLPEWVHKRRVYIYREKDVKPACQDYAFKGVDEFIKETGLIGFQLENIDFDDGIAAKIIKSTEQRRGERYVINFGHLDENLEKFYNSGAYVILSNKLEDNEVDYQWTRGDFDGLVLLKLQGRQENLEYVQKAAKKGAVRLFGYRVFKDIEGFTSSKHDPSNCLAEEPGKNLCDACGNNIKILWKVIGDMKGQNFLKKDILDEIEDSNISVKFRKLKNSL